MVFLDNSKQSENVILIDASKLGEEYQEGNNKKVRLTDAEIDLIVDTFVHKKKVDDFSAVVSYEKLIEKKCSLAAGQYFDIKIEHVEISKDEFERRVKSYVVDLQKRFDEGDTLEAEILSQLGGLKYE